MKHRRFRISGVLSLALAVLSGTCLYAVSQEVHRAEGRLSSLRSSISDEEEAIRTLQAEWACLNSPPRLDRLARQYLEMDAPAPQALLAGAQDLPEVFVPALPSRKPDVLDGPAIRPVSASSRAVPSPVPIPATFLPDATKADDGEDFNMLLRNLGGGGGG